MEVSETVRFLFGVTANNVSARGRKPYGAEPRVLGTSSDIPHLRTENRNKREKVKWKSFVKFQ
ncbi:MAG: hypothetical protein WA063_07175 [Minisyncoccia bacterium]